MRTLSKLRKASIKVAVGFAVGATDPERTRAMLATEAPEVPAVMLILSQARVNVISEMKNELEIACGARVEVILNLAFSSHPRDLANYLEDKIRSTP